jgi:hypothetical protein
MKEEMGLGLEKREGREQRDREGESMPFLLQ